MTREEELGVGRAGRKVDIRDEYYVRISSSLTVVTLAFVQNPVADDERVSQRLAAKDLDDWEQQRVKRLPGESDGVL